MKRVYISGPITGMENPERTFELAQGRLQAAGYQVINPFPLNQVIPDGTHEEYMKACLPLMDLCEGIYMMDGWENSTGACREYGYALGKSMQVIYE